MVVRRDRQQILLEKSSLCKKNGHGDFFYPNQDETYHIACRDCDWFGTADAAGVREVEGITDKPFN